MIDPNYLKPLDTERIQDALSLNSCIKEMIYFRKISSTNSEGEALIRKKTTQTGTVLIADEQTRGRGRLDRRWYSPRFKNIYLSFLLRTKPSPQDLFFLTIIPALAIKDTLKKTDKLRACIKWPNDVLIGPKKIGGILVQFEDDVCVTGIGLNVNMDPSDFLEIKKTATSIKKERGFCVNREDRIIELIKNYETLFLGWEDRKKYLFHRWKKSLALPDQPLKIILNGNEVYGKILGINKDGSLGFETPQGKIDIHSIDGY